LQLNVITKNVLKKFNDLYHMFSDDINLFESYVKDGNSSKDHWVDYNHNPKKQKALKIILEIEATLKENVSCPMEFKTSLEKNLQELRALL